MEPQRIPHGTAAQPTSMPVRAKAQQGQPEPGAAGGFSALLGALDGDGLAAAPWWSGASAAEAAAEDPGLPGVAATAPGLPGLWPGAPAGGCADAAAQAAWGMQLLAQGALVAETTRIDAAPEPAEATDQDATLALFGRGGRALQPAPLPGGAEGAGRPAWAAAGRTAALPAGRGSAAGVDALAPPSSLSPSLPGAGATAPREGSVAPAAQALAGWRDTAAAALAEALPPAPGSAAPGAAAAPQPGDRGAGAPGGAWDSAGHGLQAPQGPSDSAAPAEGAAAPEAQEAVAEQVAYWVGENLQQAELTLSHEGAPVQVSVSLSGRQAHVAFRSDEDQTRALLDAGADQLRDMLGSEGLVLSGMSVGSSGARQGSAGGGDTPQGRHGARQAQVLVPAPAGAAPAAGRAGAPTDRRVDVFV